MFSATSELPPREYGITRYTGRRSRKPARCTTRAGFAGCFEGSRGLAYFLQHGQIVDHFTNLANGKTVTGVVGPVLEKDQRVTDNGNGTLTILILATGNAVLHDESGTAIARDPVRSGSRSSLMTTARRPTRSTTSSSPTWGWSRNPPDEATTFAKPRWPH
jgi:hypothetical protein